MSIEASGYAAPHRHEATRVHPAIRRVSRLLAPLAMVCIIGLLVAPWRQSVAGTGKVIAYDPTDRPQPIEAPIKGRIVAWHVQEGTVVDEGDLIAELVDNDAQILDRLERERLAAADNVRSIELSILLAETRVQSLGAARDAAVSNGRLSIQIAEERLRAAEQDLIAAEAEVQTAELQQSRQDQLAAEGLASSRTAELARLAYATAVTKRDASRAKVRAAEREVKAAQASLAGTGSKERAEVTKAEESLRKLEGDLAKARGDLAKAEIQVARQQSMRITAPVAGTVLRLVANGPGVFVKEGDQVAVIVPRTSSRAVELSMEGNDAPLIRPGDPVRLQFEGWPAVQFVGWPSVAAGTFGGEVAFVDATDDGTGHFRIVVTPAAGEIWPDSLVLRQGVRANGWVLLNEVSVGFELWRQLNGFPPAVDPPVAKTGKKEGEGK